ncbi:hypothetical protein DYB32_004590 [Aphanomyces invadans]|uniref:Uncharacterized protein n=1 Tax=Aphanomyces invadans TaxID=157072 RepID=A0A3R6WM88_9STRA|nr:hypothetical protein DYB32_004590 [Aphanomyces invadans]
MINPIPAPTVVAPSRWNSALSYSALHAADVNGDHSVTAAEVRAMGLARQLADSPPPPAENIPPPQPSAARSSQKGRYAPWLKKALGKMHHAEALWQKHRPDTAQPPKAPQLHSVHLAKKGSQTKSILHRVVVPSIPAVDAEPSLAEPVTTIWTAARDGNVAEVRRLLDADKMKVFSHNEMDGGKTILHIACWHGHVQVVMFVTMFVQATYGLDALSTYVNAIDTAYMRSTALLDTCRSLKVRNIFLELLHPLVLLCGSVESSSVAQVPWTGRTVGDVNAKLQILKLLVQFGATVEHQDAHGDNALHWSARMQAVPTVRYLIQDTDAAVYAFISENHKRQKPLDVAKLARDAKPCMATNAIYDLLRRVYKDCNIRLKIQYGKKLRLQAEAESRMRRMEDVAHAVDVARVLCLGADQMWTTAMDTAETVRNDLEAKVLDEGGKEAVGRAQLWLETKEGKAWIKNEQPEAVDAIKTLVQKGMIPKPRDLKKAAVVRLCESYVAHQEADMRDLIKKKFGRDHPSFESRDVEYYKRLVHAVAR